MTDEAKEASEKEVAKEEGPNHADFPELTINLAESSVTVVRRSFKDSGTSALFFLITTLGPNQSMNRTSLLSFGQILEIREALNQVIDSVVAGSARRFERPAVQKPAEEEQAEAS